MSAWVVSLLVFASCVGALMIGAMLARVVPEPHLSKESKDIVDRGLGILITLTALVLGLLIASAKGSYELKSSQIKQVGAKIILIDRNLRQYGDDAAQARSALQQLLRDTLSPTARQSDGNLLSADLNRATGLEDLQNKLRSFKPTTDAQRWIQTRVLQLSGDIAQSRWLLFEQNEQSIPTPFLIVLMMWLATIFASLGLFAPRNLTVYSTLLVCALSVSSAIFLIIELDHPTAGVMKISIVPLQNALDVISQ